MKKPVHWMTLPEVRDELERTQLDWQVELEDLGGVLADGQIPVRGEGHLRHQLVAHELLRRPSED